MAKRILRKDDDPILRKVCKPVPKITGRIAELAQDMLETLEIEDGVGLAGPQVGVLRRIIVVDFSRPEGAGEADENEEFEVEGEAEDFEAREVEPDPYEGKWPIVAINPEIVGQSDETITAIEACLSFPGRWGKVARPESVTVEYTDLDGNRREDTFTGMAARCFCHEIDHLDGVVYLDKVIEGTLNKDDEEEDGQEE